VVAYRSIAGVPFLKKRSICPDCQSFIPWYYNIPIISFLVLQGKCAYCKKRISWLYPFIELLTAVLMTALFFYTHGVFQFLAYFVFFSALIVSTRTDFQAIVIPQIFTLWLVPFGMLFAFYGFLRITFMWSFLGALFGYGVLWFVAVLFNFFTHKEGLGVGDMELLSLIGAFMGPICVWITIFVASISGLLFTFVVFWACPKMANEEKEKSGYKIPFGPFLALGAALYFFFQEYFMYVLFG
jgi:leader peptidase (prepilin peptidase)/N-methyltransferase